MDGMVTYGDLLRQGVQELRHAGITDAENDSWLLLSYVSGMSRSCFFLEREKPVVQSCREHFEKLLAERAKHVPLQYITGEQEFMGLPFLVNRDVLIPRQDTECLVEAALPFAAGRRVLDLCTGSGCIAISLSVLGKPEICHAADISETALQVAVQNQKKNDASVCFFQSDLFEKITEIYDVIVSNPPYIPPSVIRELAPEVRDHEPVQALDGGADGLDFYRIITVQAQNHLAPGGRLFYEIGCDQADAVMELMHRAGYIEIVCRKDYAGNDRVVSGVKRV